MKSIKEVLPEHQDLIKLEKSARKDGINVDLNFLIGQWNFFKVWKKEGIKESTLTSLFLRLVRANLRININSTKKSLSLGIENSVSIGNLFITFKGDGKLEGKQPLLRFLFSELEIKFDNLILYSQEIRPTDEKNMPFFALIGINQESSWLAARGKGGGLALWIKDA